MDAENTLEKLTFWLFLIGLSLEVLLAIVAVIISHKEDLFEQNKNLFKKIFEWLALLGAVLVLFAILTEHWLGQLQIAEKKREDELIATQSNKLAILEEKMRIKPLSERLKLFLNSYDPKIIPDVLGGLQTMVLYLSQPELDEILKLSKEPDGQKYILKIDVKSTRMTNKGPLNETIIDLNTNHLEGLK